jgi:protein-tyrosine phosphatase
VNAADFENFSFILAMDEENQRDLLKQSPESQKEKISLLLDHSSSEPSAVPELYYSGEKGFDLVLDLIEEACAELLETLSSKIQAHP